jgi:hypothetical protein
MLGVLGTSGYYIFQNTQLDAQLRQRDEALSSTISALHQQNGFYQKLMDVINKNAAQVQIDYLRVEMPERVNISGKAAQAQKANAFIDALVSASELKPFQIKAQKRFVMPSDGEKILSQFSFTGKILQDATGSGQAQAKQETKKP